MTEKRAEYEIDFDILDSDAIIKVLLSIDEAELMVLKAHIIIHRLLTAFIKSQLPQPYNTKRMRFAACFELAKALDGKKKISAEYWNLIKKMNILRNELAHNMKAADYKKKLDEFSGPIISIFDKIQPGGNHKGLNFALGYLVIYIKQALFVGYDNIPPK